MASALDQDLEDRLTTLYVELDAAIAARERSAHKVSGSDATAAARDNPCGHCKACCTATGRRSHTVTGIELAYLAARGGRTAQPTAFVAYLAQERDESGALRHPVCPHYASSAGERGEGGCSVYAARPFSCRVFGHWRLDDSALPTDCVFEGTETRFTQSSYFAEVPQARRLVALEVEYTGRRGIAPQMSETDLTTYDSNAARWLAGPPPASSGVERALYHQARGERHLADEAFATAAEQDPSSAWVWQAWGWLHQEQQRWSEAASCYARAARLEPANAEYPTLLGVALLESGCYADALEAFASSLALVPDQPKVQALATLLQRALKPQQEAPTNEPAPGDPRG
jgi:tetratricopeptide (TPR) repeat protein